MLLDSSKRALLSTGISLADGVKGVIYIGYLPVKRSV